MNSVAILTQTSLLGSGEIDISLLVFETEELALDELGKHVSSFLANKQDQFQKIHDSGKEVRLIDRNNSYFVLKVELHAVASDGSLESQLEGVAYSEQ